MVEIGLRPRCPRMTYQRLRDDGAMLSLIVAEIRADRSRPIDVGVARTARSLRTIQRSAKSLLPLVL
jgi:hypothetical protein